MKTKNVILSIATALLLAGAAQPAIAQWTPVAVSMTCVARIGDILFGANEWISDKAISRSVDEGKTWTHLSVIGEDSASATALGSEGTILYAGTWNRGIYTSLDSGKSWIAADSMGSFSSITTFASAGAIMFAAGLRETSSAILQSIDSGRHWKEIGSKTLIGPINSILIQDSLIYVSDRGGTGTISTDLGSTWANMDLDNPSVLCLNGQYLFAVCGDAQLYRSSDSGIHWSQLPIKDEISQIGIRWLIAVDSELLLCTEDAFHSHIYRSWDNGETWANYNDGISGYAEFERLIAMAHFIIAVGDGDGKSYRRPISELASVSPAIASSGALVCTPNPVRKSLFVSSKTERIASVRCFDALGRQVLARSYETLPSRNVSLDVSGLAAGIYSCQCSFENGEIRTARMVVKK